MNHTLNQIIVIARRDFMAVVATPMFLLFLLTPLFMIGFGFVSGLSGQYLAKSSAIKRQMIVIADPSQSAAINASEAALRERLYGNEKGPSILKIVAPQRDVNAQQKALLADKTTEVTAVLQGSFAAPIISYQNGEARNARFLAMIAEDVLRSERIGGTPGASLSKAVLTEVVQNVPTKNRQQKTGSGAVAVVFVLTLMIAGQAVGMMAEEKSNKVLEILAAAVPLEAVFFGKLVGLFGVALLFVAFWGALAIFGISFIPPNLGLAAFAPTIGLIPFIILCACYFTMAYMLLGAVFLGIGAQAATIREIQMMTFPVTIIQMAMFGLASAAAGNPDACLLYTSPSPRDA
jgi:ABC-2 type transport system permease protein